MSCYKSIRTGKSLVPLSVKGTRGYHLGAKQKKGSSKAVRQVCHIANRKSGVFIGLVLIHVIEGFLRQVGRASPRLALVTVGSSFMTALVPYDFSRCIALQGSSRRSPVYWVANFDANVNMP